MEISKPYNLVPVKDNCTLFAPTALFLGPGYQMVSFKFLACQPLLPWHEFRDKTDYNSAPMKDNCALFAFTPLYAAARLYSVAMGQIRISSFHRKHAENVQQTNKACCHIAAIMQKHNRTDMPLKSNNWMNVAISMHACIRSCIEAKIQTLDRNMTIGAVVTKAAITRKTIWTSVSCTIDPT